jgi:hypothetical protein
MLRGLEPPQQLKTAHLRHDEVEQKEIEFLPGDEFQRESAVRSRDHLISLTHQPARKHVAIGGIIVDHQDSARSHAKGAERTPGFRAAPIEAIDAPRISAEAANAATVLVVDDDPHRRPYVRRKPVLRRPSMLDPFIPLMEEWLAKAPHLSAVDILVRLGKQVPDRFGKGQLRTVQRLPAAERPSEGSRGCWPKQLFLYSFLPTPARERATRGGRGEWRAARPSSNPRQIRGQRCPHRSALAPRLQPCSLCMARR